jgi:hypothetical protein
MSAPLRQTGCCSVASSQKLLYTLSGLSQARILDTIGKRIPAQTISSSPKRLFCLSASSPGRLDFPSGPSGPDFALWKGYPEQAVTLPEKQNMQQREQWVVQSMGDHVNFDATKDALRLLNLGDGVGGLGERPERMQNGSDKAASCQ